MPTHAAGRDQRVFADASTIYFNSAQVRLRYGGISDMALWRWLNDEKLGFPKPFRINGRRFWKEADLSAWESGRASDGEAAA